MDGRHAHMWSVFNYKRKHEISIRTVRRDRIVYGYICSFLIKKRNQTARLITNTLEGLSFEVSMCYLQFLDVLRLLIYI